MFEANNNFTILIWTLLMAPLIVVYVRRWTMPFYGMLLYIPLAGLITVYLDRHPIALQAIDFFFIIPAYFGFLPIIQRKLKFSGIPRIFTITCIAFALLLSVQMFNPSHQNPGILVGLVGIKVWLFYIPILMLTYVHLSEPKNFMTMLRIINITVWAPALFGIAQWYAVTLYGYQKTMKFLFGDQADSVTQGFSQFSYGISHAYRIPSSFQSTGHYANFLLGALAFCYISVSLEQSFKWKWFARCTMTLLLIASFLSGARGLLLFAPLILIFGEIFQRRIRNVIQISILLVGTWFVASFVSGLEAGDVLPSVGDNAKSYVTVHSTNTIARAVKNFPMGVGTGANTIPARHVLKYSATRSQLVGLESHYAKAIVETGIVGGILAFVLLVIPLVVGIRALFVVRIRELQIVLGGAMSYQFAIFLYSFKTAIIDTIPACIFYWMFVGITFRTNAYIRSGMGAAPAPRPDLQPRQLLEKPVAGRSQSQSQSQAVP